jgi:hypothetical protein
VRGFLPSVKNINPSAPGQLISYLLGNIPLPALAVCGHFKGILSCLSESPPLPASYSSSPPSSHFLSKSADFFLSFRMSCPIFFGEDNILSANNSPLYKWRTSFTIPELGFEYAIEQPQLFNTDKLSKRAF